ncbi:MAG: hypothetical protein PUQ00_22280 [Nostoc sp. S13]|nr:hypothetical protein [Nostoc sp. S13]
MKKNSEVRIHSSESRRSLRDAKSERGLALRDAISRGFRPATFLLTTKFSCFVGVLNPIIHPPVVQNSFWILIPDS